jgi:polyhydroxybutyrate depolymerase
LKIGKIIIRIVLAAIALPLLVSLIAAAWIHVLNKTNGTIITSGEKREYLLYVPSTYNKNKATPLVISIHGAGGWPAHQKNVSHWNQLADKYGFIVVYPSGRGFPRIWPMEGEALTEDVRFISDLIDHLEATYHIDRERIFVNGLSNGGGMAFALSCTMSDRIAAVGAVAAAQLLPFSWCTDSIPVPMIMFHGTADPIVPFNGGRTWRTPTPNPFPNVPQWATSWAKRNQCEQNPVESHVAAHVTRLEYMGCAENAAVVFYKINDGGHSWPGGKPMSEWWVGQTTAEIDATSLMWTFFSEHPLSKRVAK